MMYPFTEAEAQAAAYEWGCNCGPTALAFAVHKPLEAARHAIPDFERKRYTSPTMMKAALEFLGREYTAVRVSKPAPGRLADVESMFHELPALVRVQWTGPWTKPGTNPKWAYRHTHWIVAWAEGHRIDGPVPLIFDCNGGIRGISSWESEIVPLILHDNKQWGRGWFPTHIWRLTPAVLR